MFLTVDEVLQLHAEMIESYGGDPAVLDIGLIESAVAQPHASFDGQYLHEDEAAMAAAYLFHLSKNHGFTDGNKRTALAAAIVFLKLNEVPFSAPESQLEKLTLDLVNDVRTKENAIDYFRRHIGAEGG